MMKSKICKGRIYCLISAILIFASYILQRILNMTMEQTRSTILSEALIFSFITAIVYFLVSKSDEPFYGILMAILGIRMLPPDIASLSDFSRGADLVYFLVDRFAFVIFALAIIKLCKKQEGTQTVHPVPIIAAIITVPFCNEISSALYGYLADYFNGNMICSYLASFAVYAAAMIFLLCIAVRYKGLSAKLICDFQMAALLLNAGRRICAVAINLVQGNHISRSYYCWILIYAFFLIAFYTLRKRIQKTAEA